MYCKDCGNELSEGAKFCGKCGAQVDAGNVYRVSLEVAPTSPTYVTPEEGAIYPMTNTDKNLRLAAFVINVVSCVVWGMLIIPLAWTIPMTVRSWNIYKGKKPNTLAFGILTLVFLDLVSGVLLLISRKDDE